MNLYSIIGSLILIIVILIIIIIKLIKKKTDGEFIVDTSDSEKDIYRLDLGDELENLANKKTMTLKIVYKTISRSKHGL